MSYFRCELSKSQIELLMGLINSEHNLGKVYSLRDISRVTDLDYPGCLYRHKSWLIENLILIPQNGSFRIDFNAIAELLFATTNLSIIYRFAYRHLEYSL